MGRHSKPKAPSRSGQRIATVTSAFALATTGGVTVAVGEAQAAPPGGWGPIIECESGGDPTAQNPNSSASGLFQFLDSTWQAMGGSGSAKDASVSEQYQRANALYAQSGTTPWNASRSCWDGKVSSITVPTPESSPASESKRADSDSSTRGEQAPAKKSPAKAESASGTYTVKKGDYLSKIARVRNVNGGWRAIYAANESEICDPTMIYPGQKLTLP